MPSIVQGWVSELPELYQLTLLKATRGADDVSRNDPSKKFVKILRRHVLESGQTIPHYLDDTPDLTSLQGFFTNSDHYSLHWILNFLYAAEILGYKHPTHRDFWKSFYELGCRSLHFNPETEVQLDERLSSSLLQACV